MTDREKQIKELREAGETLESIGYKFSISRERVRQICKKLGIIPKQFKSSYHFPEPQIENKVCVNADGSAVFLTDGKENWIKIVNPRLIQAIRSIYNLEAWIPGKIRTLGEVIQEVSKTNNCNERR